MHDALDRPLVWLGSSLEDLRAFPAHARTLAGYQLRRVQTGLMPSDYRTMTSVGPGVYEIRIHTRLEHRILYVARMPEAIYVLHAFEKRTRQTRQGDLSLAKRRFAEMMNLHTHVKEN
ncbi:MAG: type II toxin-antitoxin system RelE/ParE family toxin [Candidatus Eisenbacteria bacterium]